MDIDYFFDNIVKWSFEAFIALIIIGFLIKLLIEMMGIDEVWRDWRKSKSQVDPTDKDEL